MSCPSLSSSDFSAVSGIIPFPSFPDLILLLFLCLPSFSCRVLRQVFSPSAVWNEIWIWLLEHLWLASAPHPLIHAHAYCKNFHTHTERKPLVKIKDCNATWTRARQRKDRIGGGKCRKLEETGRTGRWRVERTGKPRREMWEAEDYSRVMNIKRGSARGKESRMGENKTQIQDQVEERRQKEREEHIFILNAHTLVHSLLYILSGDCPL